MIKFDITIQTITRYQCVNKNTYYRTKVLFESFKLLRSKTEEVGVGFNDKEVVESQGKRWKTGDNLTNRNILIDIIISDCNFCCDRILNSFFLSFRSLLDLHYFRKSF